MFKIIGFRNLIHLLEPGYHGGAHKLKKMLTEEASSIALTTDIWNDRYLDKLYK